ncbi:MAG: methyl-accepting chemotaxis protein [Desulfobacteraceae bacterium]|nr:methyl-accepting chemotaxis protein [Desulfobacteraceae bacterium]
MISIDIRKHISSNEQPAGEDLLKELTRRQKNSNNLRLAVTLLINYGRQMLTAEDMQKVAGIKAETAQPREHIETALENLKKANLDSTEMTGLVQNIETSYNLLKSALIEGADSIAELRGQWLDEQKKISEKNKGLTKVITTLIKELKNSQNSLKKLRTGLTDDAWKIKHKVTAYIFLIICLVTTFIMVPITWLIRRRIVVPISKLVSFADNLSQGDLTVEIEKGHNDEVGYLISKLGDMASNLNALIGQVQRSGIQVTSSATELSATSKQQEAVMKTQLDSTNYVVKSIGEISSVSEELVDTMQKVAAMSEQTADFASRGQTDLAQMEDAMLHMENASKSISGKLEAINEKAANITSVVTTITKVADQTNLLSLNAAIEAEKAGEYGRGFTVVAREIRRLADQTAVATLDIEQMVQEMQSAVSAGVMEMDAFITEVQQSAENVGKISIQLTRIIEQVQALTPSFEGVNESMQFQAGSAHQINSSMVNLSEEMQQTVESLRESFMAIEQLNDAAKGLQDEVSRFKVMY